MADVKKVDNKPVEEKVVKETTPATAPKKSNTGLIVGIVLLVVIVLPAIGFGAFAFFVKNKIDDATENGEINVNLGDEKVSLNTNTNQSWPNDLPVAVPEFTAGDINSSGSLNNYWSIIIENATREDLLKYKTTLTEAGWTAEETMEYTGVVSISATKGDYGVNVTLTTDEDGKTSTLYTLAKSSEMK